MGDGGLRSCALGEARARLLQGSILRHQGAIAEAAAAFNAAVELTPGHAIAVQAAVSVFICLLCIPSKTVMGMLEVISPGGAPEHTSFAGEWGESGDQCPTQAQA